jgi:hypothetical protein
MATFGRDIPLGRPGPGQRATVMVPRADAEEAVRELLRNGSGMAGFANGDGTVTVYFENNKFSDPALLKWERKVFKAYDRMVNGSPTVNKLTCDMGELAQVGMIAGPEILVYDMALLTDWLRRSDALDSAPDGPEIHA